MAKASKDPINSEDTVRGQVKASSDKARNDKARLWNSVAAQQQLIAKSKELDSREMQATMQEVDAMKAKKEIMGMMLELKAQQDAIQQMGMTPPAQLAPLPGPPQGMPMPPDAQGGGMPPDAGGGGPMPPDAQAPDGGPAMPPPDQQAPPPMM